MGMGRSSAYYYGLAVGIAVALVLVFLIKRVIFGKRTGAKREYDERQKQAMGIAYKCGYYTLLFYLVGIALFDLTTGIRWCDLYTSVFIGILLSVSAFAAAGIRLDAYFPFRESPRRYIALLTVLGALNVAIGVWHYIDTGTFLEDGLLSHSIINPLAGVLLLLLAAAMAMKSLSEKRAEKEQDK